MGDIAISNVLLIIAFVILIIFVILISYKYMDSELNQRYRDIQSNHEKGEENLEKRCPKGCLRGRCDYKGTCYDPFYPNPKCCAFDKQCRYCKDKDGIIVDKAADSSEDNIRNNYYKKFEDVSDLNTKIKEENKYINKMNKEIRRKNKSIFNR